MPRIRTIKPETAEDEKLGTVSRDARLMFILLWTICDDHGRFRAAPIHLRSRLFGYDEDASLTQVAGWLGELTNIGRVRLYEVDGERYGVVTNWSKHQRIDNASKPLYPEPPESSEEQPPPPQPSASLREHPQESASDGDSPLDLDLDLDLDLEGTGKGGGVRGGGIEPPQDTEPARLCNLLADSIGQRGAKRPTVTKRWTQDMDRLLRIDGRQPSDIERVIHWLNTASDEVAAFWRPNIRSPAKLRQRWDQMAEQYHRRRRRPSTREAWEGTRHLVAVSDPDVNPLDALYGRPAS